MPRAADPPDADGPDIENPEFRRQLRKDYRALQAEATGERTVFFPSLLKCLDAPMRAGGRR
jgi:hypothetical protein